MGSEVAKPLRFEGHKSLAQRIVVATLTGRSILISKIRPDSYTSDFAPHEVSFLRLIDGITNGSTIEFSSDGTRILYQPGLITGCAPGLGASGGVLKHELPANCARGISYFLIPLCMLAPFSKNPFNIIFTGPGVITSATASGDVSIDTVRTAILPLYAHFGIQVKLELRINRRSGPGKRGVGGAGEVQLIFGQQIRLPKTLHLLSPGRIRNVRGVAYSVGVPGSNNARMTETARGILNPLVPDTYIFGDVSAAPRLPADPKSERKDTRTGIGFGLSLVATSSSGCVYSADVASPHEGGVPAEDIGKQCALQLLEKISQGGCVDSVGLPTVLTLMALGSEDVGRVQVSKDVLASEEIVQLARDFEIFGLNRISFREAGSDAPDTDVVAVMKGRGIGNVGRKMA